MLPLSLVLIRVVIGTSTAQFSEIGTRFGRWKFVLINVLAIDTLSLLFAWIRSLGDNATNGGGA